MHSTTFAIIYGSPDQVSLTLNVTALKLEAVTLNIKGNKQSQFV